MTDSNSKPLIVAFVADLMFTTKIANVAKGIDYRVEWVETAEQLGSNEGARRELPGENLAGRRGKLFDKITAWQPALLVFDLTNKRIPWKGWIPALKSSPATRRMPILCFGPHEDADLLKEAKRVGGNYVLGRSKFTADMPAIFQKYARIPNYEGLQNWCAEPLPDLVLEGIDLFNQGHFYKCHDALEEAWRADSGAGRNLYKGILQVGIAYFQIERGNYRGALKMLLRARQWFEPLPDSCRGVNVRALQANMERVHTAVLELGAEKIEEFDRSLFEPIQLIAN